MKSTNAIPTQTMAVTAARPKATSVRESQSLRLNESRFKRGLWTERVIVRTLCNGDELERAGEVPLQAPTEGTGGLSLATPS